MKDKLVEWIEQQLRDRGWSQSELSRRARIDKSYLSKILRGERQPSLSFYTDLAEALNEPIEKILRLDGVLRDDVDDSDLTLREYIETGKRLTPEQRLEVLNFADYLAKKAKKRSDNTD